MQSDDTDNNQSIEEYKKELETSGNQYCQHSATCVGFTLFLGLSYGVLQNDISLYSACICAGAGLMSCTYAINKYYKAHMYQR